MLASKLYKQGDIIKVDNISFPVLVVSKDYFNNTGEIIGCPIISEGSPGPLHIPIKTKKYSGFVHCEKIKLLDMNVRRGSKSDTIPMSEIINITDAIQSIFDYV